MNILDNTSKTIFEIMIKQIPYKEHPEGYDCINFVYNLWLRRPRESIKKGYMCSLRLPIFGNQWEDYKDSPEETADLLFEMFNSKFTELCAVAFPYIEDGCVEISNSPEGPWTNLMPGGMDERII